MDLIQYRQLYNKAMNSMDTLFDDMKDSMKSFNQKQYQDVFEYLLKKYGEVFACIEELYNNADDKEKCLKELAERFVGCAQNMIQSQKWKFKRESMLIDCNLFVVGYIIPAILEYKGNMSEPFAQTLIDSWNETFKTRMECGNHDRINDGFSTTILGIKFGK